MAKQLERFVRTPVVSVIIAEYRSKNVVILGEVGRPGKYPMKGDSISLREAIIEAGLPTRAAALRRVLVVKPDVGSYTFEKVDLYKALYKGEPKNNLELVPGDIVVVPSTVPVEFNRALSTLLAPFIQAEAGENAINNDWGTSQ